MEIQYTGDNVKEIIEFCGECIDGYWTLDNQNGDMEEALTFISKSNAPIPLIKGDWVTDFREGFILVTSLHGILSKQGIHNGTKQGPKSQLETNEA